MKKFGKWIAVAIVVIIAFAIVNGTAYTISSNERGVLSTWGEAKEVMQPGFHMKSPIGQTITRLSISPKEIKIVIAVGSDAAVSKDLQEIGVTSIVNYKYDEGRMLDIVKRYHSGDVDRLVQNAFINSVKATIGKYSISELVPNTSEIIKQVKTDMEKTLNENDTPVDITQLTLDNWDWPDSYNARVQQTMETAQQVKIAEQELAIANQNSQKQVVEAQAKLEAERLNAEAVKVAAEAEAEAMRTKNAAIQATLAIQRETWAHEEKMKELEKWNGVKPGSVATELITTPQYSVLSTAER